MKKVLVALDGTHFPSVTLNFALELNHRSPILLTGIFLPSIDYAELVSYSFYGNAIASLYLEESENDDTAIKKNMGLFEDFCNKHHIRYKIHNTIQDKVTKGLQKETRYADLLLLSSAHFYKNLGQMVQQEYLTGTLHKTECPVVLLPQAYARPENVILAYDGSASSMFAIKQFIYLFPQLTDLNTLIVYADENREKIPSLSLVKEYASQHFSKLAYYKLDEDPGEDLNKWISNKSSSMVVSGSYGRSAFSELFRKNFLKNLVKEQGIPLFIAHP